MHINMFENKKKTENIGDKKKTKSEKEQTINEKKYE